MAHLGPLFSQQKLPKGIQKMTSPTIGDIPELPEILGTYLKCRYDPCGVWQGMQYVSLPHFSYGSSKINVNDIPAKKWEIRSLEALSPHTIKNKVLSWLPLKNNAEVQLSVLSSNLRRKIRKAQTKGFALQSGGAALIPDFHNLFSKQMHQLGAPSMEQAFYHHIITSLGESRSKVFTVHKNHQVIGTAILIFYKDFAENCWVATDPSWHTQYITYFLHWAIIQFCITHTINTYSFGRSTINSGVHQFKKQWNTEDHILYRNFSHTHPLTLRNNAILAQGWKNTPRSVTKHLGPYIARKFY